MADGNRELSYEIYWTRDESLYNSDSEGVLHSYAPGVDQPGNRKPTQKTKHQQRRDVPSRASRDEKMMEGRDGKLGRHERRKEKETKTVKTASMEVTKRNDKPSLKDLRPEDKKRIANLIRELAKVGEEKEVIVQQLNVERRSYEDKVSKLQQQMEAIVQERELTQTQYLECQKLLAEYQSQLASEQEKLAVSLHHPVSPPKFNMVPQSLAKATSGNQPNGFQPSTPRPTMQRPSTQHVTQGHPNGYPSAPHQNGYRHPGTHPAAPSLKQGNHPSRVDRNRPPGTQQYLVPGTQSHHNPVPSTQSHHHPSSLDPEFNPTLASTHRSQPSNGESDRSWAEPQAAGSGTPAMYVSYGNTGGYVLRPGLDTEQEIHFPQTGPPSGYLKDSQETLASRSQSGEFRPLQPELETDFSSQGSHNSPEYVAEFWKHQNSTKHTRNTLQANDHGDGIGVNRNHQGDFHPFQDAVARQPTYQTVAEQRHSLLEKQRHQLHREQAWLRQKLKDQEEMLRRKQSQLELHRVHQLAREQQQDYRLEREWQDYGNGIGQTSDPQANRTDPEWEEPNLFNGIRQEAPSGSESDNDDVISTNYPPSFANHSPTKHTLENSMRRLDLSQGRRQRSADVSSTKAAMATGKRNLTPKSQGEAIDGYASLYPTSQPRHKIQGSTSSHSPSTSSSPTLVDQSTSPLYRDRSTVTARSPGQGNLSLSPGRVHVTLAPALQQKTSREQAKTRHQQRLTDRRAVSLPQSPRYHSEASEKKRNVTHLSDLIAEMESPPPPSAPRARPADATHNTSVIRPGSVPTPDLFQDDVAYTDTDAELQESRILEDVFFL
ncbi:uncharacterized protein LOC119724139 [Patiria miniata]|uniref:Uncharacterized protein n=1 Tax=Patiria miniata TaxID=46514 RepID=A0A913ZIW5_PATMI|nr:uncharacterized protein LOC119724139 [Patiria miniata]